LNDTAPEPEVVPEKGTVVPEKGAKAESFEKAEPCQCRLCHFTAIAQEWREELLCRVPIEVPGHSGLANERFDRRLGMLLMKTEAKAQALVCV
jgi:hypothetical protein